MSHRSVSQLISAVDTQDGAGVRLRRALGAQPGARLDPSLMLDAFSSDDPNDYITGFPAHPHRGFETATYILDGHMLHEDHLGNRGDLMAGGVQWMTAGKRHHSFGNAATDCRAFAWVPIVVEFTGARENETCRVSGYSRQRDPAPHPCHWRDGESDRRILARLFRCNAASRDHTFDPGPRWPQLQALCF